MAKTVRDAMTPNPRCISRSTSVVIAAVRRLPVVDSDRLIGMLAQADVVHEVKDKKAGQLVEEISQPSENPN